MNHERMYQYRFRDVEQGGRKSVWIEIAKFICTEVLADPDVLLDPAAGRCEFINAAPVAERWCVDAVDQREWRNEGVRFLLGNALSVDLPRAHFDAVFASNFLEHLRDGEEVAGFLERMLEVLRPGGRIAIMGPNFKYCSREYFDCADHATILTEISVAEHLYASGFEVERVVPRFLPFSFRGFLPPSARLTSLYLQMPMAWRVLGKQFLVVGRAPGV